MTAVATVGAGIVAAGVNYAAGLAASVLTQGLAIAVDLQERNTRTLII
jgi:hypothetical protein